MSYNYCHIDSFSEAIGILGWSFDLSRASLEELPANVLRMKITIGHITILRLDDRGFWHRILLWLRPQLSLNDCYLQLYHQDADISAEILALALGRQRGL